MPAMDAATLEAEKRRSAIQVSAAAIIRMGMVLVSRRPKHFCANCQCA